MQMTIQALQDAAADPEGPGTSCSSKTAAAGPGEPCVAELTEENFQRLHAEHERQAKGAVPAAQDAGGDGAAGSRLRSRP